MKSIKEFENQKLENLNQVFGGRCVTKYPTGGDDCGVTVTDKEVRDNCGNLIKTVTNLESWFNRD